MSRIVIGLIADTHVPDRRRRLHPQVLPLFREAGVAAILHCGDICIPSILDQLEQVAPVIAVRGNRDWFDSDDLPMRRSIIVGAVRIGLTHGHGGWGRYLRDKLHFLMFGPRSFEHFAQRAIKLVGESQVVVFGHNHEPMVKELNGRLVVNPGSACCQSLPGKPPSIGFLTIEGNKVAGKIVNLE